MDYARRILPISGQKVDSWPEVVGLKAEEAACKIKQDMPRASVHLVPEGFAITMDYKHHRVRLFLDSQGRVLLVPKFG